MISSISSSKPLNYFRIFHFSKSFHLFMMWKYISALNESSWDTRKSGFLVGITNSNILRRKLILCFISLWSNQTTNAAAYSLTADTHNSIHLTLKFNKNQFSHTKIPRSFFTSQLQSYKIHNNSICTPFNLTHGFSPYSSSYSSCSFYSDAAYTFASYSILKLLFDCFSWYSPFILLILLILMRIFLWFLLEFSLSK
jgi:hypothetical protein